MKFNICLDDVFEMASSSARRTWIEMTELLFCIIASKSSSARRTWIEMIMFQGVTAEHGCVVLRKEDVD